MLYVLVGEHVVSTSHIMTIDDQGPGNPYFLTSAQLVNWQALLVPRLLGSQRRLSPCHHCTRGTRCQGLRDLLCSINCRSLRRLSSKAASPQAGILWGLSDKYVMELGLQCFLGSSRHFLQQGSWSLESRHTTRAVWERKDARLYFS